MTRAGAITSVATLVLIAGLLAACGTSEASTPPTSIASVEPGTIGPPEPSPSLDPGLPGQSESDWGPIWDAVPATFPVPLDARPTEPESGPVSAAYLVPDDGGGPRALAEFYATGLEERGLPGAVDGPLEDGSVTAWGSNGYGCDALVTVLPRGDDNLVTVLYGAGCPFA